MTLGSYSIELSVSNGLVSLLLLGIFGVLAYRVYRPSRDSKKVHLILFVSRFVVILLCVLLWMAPRLTIKSHGVRKPLIAVLVDNSESMQIFSGDGPRYDSVVSLLDSGVFRGLRDRARVMTLRFDESLAAYNAQDSSLWHGSATDIAGCLSQLSSRVKGEGLAGVFLLSDGAHNIGQNPGPVSEKIGAPVYTVPIGAEDPPHDIALTSILVPSIGFVGRPIVVKARLKAVGLDRLPHQIRAYSGERQVGRTPIMVDDGEQEATISFMPDAVGLQTIRVAIPVIEGEVEEHNNQELGRVEVLEAKSKVFLVGNPSTDFAYLVRTLRADSNLTVETLIPERAGGWPSSMKSRLVDTDGHDLVILHDVPVAILSVEVGAGLRRRVMAGSGLLLVCGEDSGVPDWGAGLLPLEPDPKPYSAAFVTHRLNPDAVQHPILAFGDDPNFSQEAWSSLPPFTGVNPTKLREGSGSTVLIEQEVSGSPLVAIRIAGMGKVAVVAARGFARQALMMQGIGKTDKVVRAFWNRMTRWLLTEDDLTKLRVSTGKSSYRSGETIDIRAELFDDLLEPVVDADVLLEVEGGPDDAIILAHKGEGKYTGVIRGLKQGTNSYRVSARWNEEGKAEAVGELTIGRYSVEFEDLLANASLMQEIAVRSRGRVVGIDAIPEFVDSMKLAPQPNVSVLQLRLWGENWSLLFLVMFLGFEWFVRRNRGMV